MQNFVFPPFTAGPYGSFVYLRADTGGLSGYGTPLGSINFADSGGSAFPASYVLNSAGSTATPIFTFPVGSHSITASYTGDSSFLGSSSSPVPFTITAASTTTAVTATGATQGITFNAIVSTSSGGYSPSGSLIFNVNGTSNTVGLSLATPAVINPVTHAVITGAQGSASFTASNLTVGQTYTATVSYNGDSNYSASSASVKGTVQSDFVMGLTPNIMTIQKPGFSGVGTVTIGAQNGFTGTVTPTCSGLPGESTCSFSPPKVTGSGSITLTISTKAPTARLAPPHDLPLWSAFSAMALFGMFLSGTRPRSRGRAKFILAIILLSVGLSVNCGGGSSSSQSTPSTPDPGTPVGQYTVTVTGTSSALTHAVTFALLVQ